MTPPSELGQSPVVWDEAGRPRSRLFDDIYFSTTDGLAESRAVFLAGCGLPQAWAGRRASCVGELGFGSGLNILALIDLWARTREPGARLHVFSVEAFPMDAADARRALAPWPELARLAERLLARWPRRRPGFHRLAFDDLDVTLDLAVMDAAEALAAWSGRADAWFLDGFSPACNPAMWSEAVLTGVAARSAPGARVATFTVAGAVRRGLEAAGFATQKQPGFGGKRQRLEARAPGDPVEPNPARRVAIVGAGVAGAALARAFTRLGAQPVVFEAEGPGAGASGNPAALVMPRLDAGGGEIARLYAQAFARAVDVYTEIPAAIIARGAVQLENGPKDPSRFDRIAASGLFDAGRLARIDASAASEWLGEPAPAGGLRFEEAVVVEPASVLDAWLAGAEVRHAAITRIERVGTLWRLIGEGGALVGEAEVVCFAAGPGSAALALGAPLSAVRGQISVARSPHRPAAALWGGYVVPGRDQFVFGATHDREDAGCEVREADHARNRALLAQGRPALAAALQGEPLEGRASARAVTPDFLPLAGAWGELGAGEGLYILSGLGSRGFCAAPLLAEHVAAPCAPAAGRSGPGRRPRPGV
jgi:tRNA 5-methylaminomethyl-2-thiouridine biosynthesis bifunctional protein